MDEEAGWNGDPAWLNTRGFRIGARFPVPSCGRTLTITSPMQFASTLIFSGP